MCLTSEQATTVHFDADVMLPKKHNCEEESYFSCANRSFLQQREVVARIFKDKETSQKHFLRRPQRPVMGKFTEGRLNKSSIRSV